MARCYVRRVILPVALLLAVGAASLFFVPSAEHVSQPSGVTVPLRRSEDLPSPRLPLLRVRSDEVEASVEEQDAPAVDANWEVAERNDEQHVQARAPAVDVDRNEAEQGRATAVDVDRNEAEQASVPAADVERNVVASTPRAGYFEGRNTLSRVRIAIADSALSTEPVDIVRARCFAVTVSSLFPYSFEHIVGNDDSTHVDAWLRREYCSPFARYTQPKYVLLVATCLRIQQLFKFVRIVVTTAGKMELESAAAAGLIWLKGESEPDGNDAPHMRPYVVIVDTHMYYELGCPDVGPFNASMGATGRMHQPLPHFTAEGASSIRGSIRRLFVKDHPAKWFAVGAARFMTNYLASVLARNGTAIGLPAALLSLTDVVPSVGMAMRVACAANAVCEWGAASKPVDAVVAGLSKQLSPDKLPYTSARSSNAPGCFDFADLQGCALNPKVFPSYLATNEPPYVVTHFVQWTATFVVPRLAPGTVHFMSVVGGMNGLNVAAGLSPTSTTFFDYGATLQISVGRVFLEVLMRSNSRADFMSSMFGRDFAKFLREDPEGEMTMASQVRYLQQPVDEAIFNRTLAQLSPLAAACYSAYFGPKMRAALEFRTYTPLYVTNERPHPQAGNFTVHYGVPGGFLGSEEAMLALRDSLRRSPIGFADYDFNRFEDLLLHRETQRSDNLVVHISNADDKHYPYIPNIEKVLSEASVWLQHVRKPSKVFVVSTNGVYMASVDGWTFHTTLRL